MDSSSESLSTTESINLKIGKNPSHEETVPLFKDDDEKINRLKFLVEKSKVYSTILADRLLDSRSRSRSRSQSLPSSQVSSVPTTPESNISIQKTPIVKKRGRKSKATLKAEKEARQLSIKDFSKAVKEEQNKNNINNNSPNLSISNDNNDFSEYDEIKIRQPSLITGGVLRKYQLDGVEWLVSLFENGLNGILADEMGLGKTLQTIGFIAYLIEKKVKGPFLIVAPLSVIKNWQNEFNHFAPKISPILLYHGSKHERSGIRTSGKLKSATVVITSYEMIISDAIFLRNLSWQYIVIDEGHRLKNLNCTLIKELKTYDSANRLLLTGTPLQNNLAELWSLLNFLLPDIFADLNLFQSWFESALEHDASSGKGGHKIKLINQKEDSELIQSLHAILRPFLLRRDKLEVEKSLPLKHEMILFASISKSQLELYDAILHKNIRQYLFHTIFNMKLKKLAPYLQREIKKLSIKSPWDETKTGGSRKKRKISYVEDSLSSDEHSDSESESDNQNKTLSVIEKIKNRFIGNSNKTDKKLKLNNFQIEKEASKLVKQTLLEINAKKLQNRFMQLRLVCDSPFLFYWPWDDDCKIDDSIVTESGKMQLIDQLVPRLLKQDKEAKMKSNGDTKNLDTSSRKILIFSQFTTMLDILETWATEFRGYSICRIDGSVSYEDRQEAVNVFNTSPDHKIFLLGTRAGGLGLNLTTADTVILFDSDWNPQMDRQAMDRAHRIGQNKSVMVYRLATRNTVEDLIIEKAATKRNLANIVITKGKFSHFANFSDENNSNIDSHDGKRKRIVDEESLTKEPNDTELSEVYEKIHPCEEKIEYTEKDWEIILDRAGNNPKKRPNGNSLLPYEIID